MSQKRTQKQLPILQPDAAGIDVAAEEIFVAVPADRDPEPVRRYRTFTPDLHELADWLTRCGIRSVAMESTSVSWIPLHQILEERGFEIYWVNAHYRKNVPGRKSDAADCQWIQYLHLWVSYGPAFDRRPKSALSGHYGDIGRTCSKWPPSIPCTCKRRWIR